MTPEYRQELKKTLATLNKIAPAKFQLLSQDIPSETKDILEEIDSILPPDAYISRSWLLQQLYVLEKELSDEQKIAIKEGIKFFDNHREDYAKIKDNPTFESIKQTGLANCGELASALVNDVQKGRELSHVGIQNYTFFRVAINYRNCLADSMPEMQKMDTLRHIFLVYSTKKNETLQNIVRAFCQSDSPQALDLWSRKAGNTRTLVDEILNTAKSNNATLEIQDSRSGQTARLSYDKDKKTFSMLEPQGLHAYSTNLKNKDISAYFDRHQH